MTRSSNGSMIAAFAFVLWGLLPLYFQFIPQADVFELLAVRLIVSIPLMWILVRMVPASWRQFLPALRSKKVWLLCLLAGLFNCVSLYSFTWALTNGQVLAASLGYFINPIFSVVFGVLFLKDRLTLAQRAAVVLSVLGIGCQVLYYGELPWLSLVMGGAFALYGLIKKFIPLDSLSAMLIELLALLPLAAVLIGAGWHNQDSALYQQDWSTLLWYAGAAPVTLVPLVLFAMAVERTSLIMVGLAQYIEPSIQFLLAVMLFGEPLSQVKVISFSCIWLGLLLCTLEALLRRRQKHFKQLA